MNDNNPPQREMPRYISCKRVWALKIAKITEGPAETNIQGGSWLLHFEEPGYAPLEVPHIWLTKHKPEPGWFFIQYEDGYRSACPADVFERGNTPEAAWGMPRSQDPKFGVNLKGRLFNRDTGEEVPRDEPVMVLRARDLCTLATIHFYRNQLPVASANVHSVDERLLAFSAFRDSNPTRMKYPDGVGAKARKPMPPEPPSLNPQRWAPGEREGS